MNSLYYPGKNKKKREKNISVIKKLKRKEKIKKIFYSLALFSTGVYLTTTLNTGFHKISTVLNNYLRKNTSITTEITYRNNNVNSSLNKKLEGYHLSITNNEEEISLIDLKEFNKEYDRQYLNSPTKSEIKYTDLNQLLDEMLNRYLDYNEVKNKIEKDYFNLNNLTYKIKGDYKKESFIDRINSIKFEDKVLHLYNDLIKSFPKLYETAYKLSIEYNFDPAIVMGLVTIEGGIQIKYLNGIKENGKELKIKNPLSDDVKGVCQISRITWETYGKDFSWEDLEKYEPNITVAIKTLKAYYKMFHEISDALVAYNLGPGKTMKVKKKYAHGKTGEVSKILARWVKCGFKEYKESAYYPRRILETAYYFKKILEKAGLYDNAPKNPSLKESYIRSLPGEDDDEVFLKPHHFEIVHSGL